MQFFTSHPKFLVDSDAEVWKINILGGAHGYLIIAPTLTEFWTKNCFFDVQIRDLQTDFYGQNEKMLANLLPFKWYLIFLIRITHAKMTDVIVKSF